MELHHHPLLHLALIVGRLVLGVGLAQEGQRGPIGAGRGLDHVWQVALVRQIVAIRQVLAAAAILRFAVGAGFDDQFVALPHELAFHMTAEIEIAPMGNALQLAELARRQERKRVFDIGRAARIVAQLFRVVVAQPQPLAGQSQIQIPLIAPVAPERVPLGRRVGMAEELDFHLLELARAEREIPRRDLVAKALAHLRDTERHADPGAVEHVLEVDENTLCRLGPQERRALLARQRADVRLEHQVELARFGERADFFGVGP